MTASVAIVIPTRNRSDLAIAAIESLLPISDGRLKRIIVSNNSSEPADVRRLARHCERLADRRLLHIRPPGPLGMAEHWDWAIGQAFESTDATHFALHYDRRVSKPELPMIFDVAAERPDVPVTYLLDMVHPMPTRFFAHHMPWTGGVYEIRTARAVELASSGRLTDLWQAFPVLVNCLTPRSVLQRVRARFGDYCASTSPESCFGFRYCAVAQTYLHFDRPLGVHYGSALSNGMGYLRGDSSGAFADFIRLRGERPWLDAAPLTGLSLGQNSFYHEYETVRRSAGEGLFPPIEMQGYLNDLARGLVWIADPAGRSETRALLLSHGWRNDEDSEQRLPPPRRRAKEWFWNKLDLLRADFLSMKPADLCAIGLKSEARALRHARQHERPASASEEFIAPLKPIRLR